MSLWLGVLGGQITGPPPWNVWQYTQAGAALDVPLQLIYLNENIYVAGYTRNSINRTNVDASDDALLFKINQTKTIEWVNQVGGNGVDRFNCIDYTSDGTIWVGGVAATALFGQPSAGGSDCILYSYNQLGNRINTIQFGSAFSDQIEGISIDRVSDRIYVVGTVGGSIFGQPSAGGSDIFISRYNTSGNRIWTIQSGTAGNDNGRAVKVETSTGNVYVAGDTSSSFGGQTAIGGTDALLIKYSSDGIVQWTRQFGTAGNDIPRSIGIDSGGSVYVCGQTSGAFSGFTNSGSQDVFVVKFNSSGTQQWARQIGTSGLDAASSILILGDALYVSGSAQPGFDGLTGTPAGSNIFLIKYDLNGTKQWTKMYGTDAAEGGITCLAEGPSGSILISGNTSGSFPGYTNQGANVQDIVILKVDASGNLI